MSLYVSLHHFVINFLLIHHFEYNLVGHFSTFVRSDIHVLYASLIGLVCSIFYTLTTAWATHGTRPYAQ